VSARYRDGMPERPYTLSCHCNAIRLSVDADLDGLLSCNCSTCRRFGAIHWYVPSKAVTMLEGSKPLSTYAWRFVHEGHHFCGTCGTSVMRTGYPDGTVALNVCMVEEIDPHALDVKRFDGRTKIKPGVTR